MSHKKALLNKWLADSGMRWEESSDKCVCGDACCARGPMYHIRDGEHVLAFRTLGDIRKWLYRRQQRVVTCHTEKRDT